MDNVRRGKGRESAAESEASACGSRARRARLCRALRPTSTEAVAEPSAVESSREDVSFFDTQDGRGMKNGAQVIELSRSSDDTCDCSP